jgi:hypothetical protein
MLSGNGNHITRLNENQQKDLDELTINLRLQKKSLNELMKIYLTDKTF